MDDKTQRTDKLTDILKALGEQPPEVPVDVVPFHKDEQVKASFIHGTEQEVLDALNKMGVPEAVKNDLKQAMKNMMVMSHYDTLFDILDKASRGDKETAAKLVDVLHHHAHAVVEEMNDWDKKRRAK